VKDRTHHPHAPDRGLPSQEFVWLAEGEGFEPSIRLTTVNRFRDRFESADLQAFRRRSPGCSPEAQKEVLSAFASRRHRAEPVGEAVLGDPSNSISIGLDAVSAEPSQLMEGRAAALQFTGLVSTASAFRAVWPNVLSSLKGGAMPLSRRTALIGVALAVIAAVIVVIVAYSGGGGAPGY
jgi:hypothetical protein